MYDEGDHLVEKRDGTGKTLFKNEPHKNHFVKIRITHDPDDKEAPKQIAALLEALGGALK